MPLRVHCLDPRLHFRAILQLKVHLLDPQRHPGRNPAGNGGGAVVEAGAEVGVGNPEGAILFLLAAEGHALQGPGPVRGVGVGEGPGIVVPCSCSVESRGLRPVRQVCVVRLHGAPGLDLCRQVKQIVRGLQGIGGMSGRYSQKQINKDKAIPVKGESLSCFRIIITVVS